MKFQFQLLIAAAALAFAATPQAAPVPSGLTIDVTRTSFELSAATPGASQGSVTFGTFGGAANSGGTGSFTETGDRIGATLVAQGTSTGNPPGSTAGLFGFDYAVTLTNSTATDFEVMLTALVLNQVSATGSDAYAKSIFVVRRGVDELFFSDFRVDTFNTGQANNFQQASPNNVVTLLIAANSSLLLTASQEIEGGAFSPSSSFSASLDAALQLTSARSLGGGGNPGPPNGVPLPGTLALLLVTMPGLVLSRRRR